MLKHKICNFRFRTDSSISRYRGSKRRNPERSNQTRRKPQKRGNFEKGNETGGKLKGSYK